MEFPEGVGGGWGQAKKTFCERGMDIYWNKTILIINSW